MATADGTVKKTALSFFSRPMARGIIAVDLAEGDYLIGVALTDGTQEIMLFSDAGKAVRFAESEVRAMGRNAAGVRGMKLGVGQQVISLITASDETLSVLTATQNGYGKRTQIAEYTRHGRGTQGMIAIQCSERNGKLVAAQLVSHTDEIVLITTGGVLIRTRVSEVREAGRSTQGVRLINLGDNEALAGLQKIIEPDEVANGTNGESTNGNGSDGDGGNAPAGDASGDAGPDDDTPDGAGN
jgi:DNA gyrase subunit A